MATISELKQKANLVANATEAGENTATRVGGVLQDAASLIEQLQNSAVNMITLTEEEYDALVAAGTVDADTYYNVLEEE